MQAEYGNQLIVVNHHENDVFEIPWVEQRVELYGAGVIPHVRIDGKYAIRGAQSCSWAAAEYRAAIEQRLGQTNGLSPIAITGAYLVAADSVRVTATFTLLDAVALPDLRGFLLVLVDDLYWAGVYYDHVTQGASSQNLTLVQPDDAATISAVFARQPTWNSDDIHCLAFCQRMSDSLDVHQAAWLTEAPTWVEEDPARTGAAGMWASPNPFPASRGTLRIALEQPGGHSASAQAAEIPAGGALPAVEILDGRGRLVLRIASDPSTFGTSVVHWDGRDRRGHPVPAGAYWVRATGADALPATRVIVIR